MDRVRASRAVQRAVLGGLLAVGRAGAEVPPSPDEDSRRPSIRNPGLDIANFPDGSQTLPKGAFQLETSPVGFYGSNDAGPAQYSWEVFLRYGLTDELELRIFTSGLSHNFGSSPTTGLAPPAVDLKVHLLDPDPERHIPSIGIEAYVLTTWGSEAFDAGTQPSLSLLVDHALPFGIDFNWNAGVVATARSGEETVWEGSFSWAFQRNFTPDVALFLHGYYNAAVPRITPGDAQVHRSNDALVVGAGGVYRLSDRLALFGSLNGGLTPDAPSYIATAGLGFAF